MGEVNKASCLHETVLLESTAKLCLTVPCFALLQKYTACVTILPVIPVRGRLFQRSSNGSHFSFALTE